jgi:DNA-binding NtrC family response regulator
LRTYGENVSQVARAAGVDRKTMRRLLNKYGLRSS